MHWNNKHAAALIKIVMNIQRAVIPFFLDKVQTMCMYVRM